MLNRLVPLLAELDVVSHWDVITGGNDFFEVTKAFHNALHGAEYELTRHAQEIFLTYNEQNRTMPGLYLGKTCSASSNVSWWLVGFLTRRRFVGRPLDNFLK